RLLIDALYGAAEPKRQPIILRPVVIQLGIERSRILEEARCVLEVVGETSQGHVRVRNQRQDLLRNRADSSRIDNVRLAVKDDLAWYRSGCRAGCGIIDVTVDRPCLTGRQALDTVEVAVAEVIGWDRKPVEPPARVINPQNVPKKKQLVLENWPAHVAAIIVVGCPRERERTVEELASRQGTDPVEFICRAMKVIGSRFQADVGHRSSDPPEFCQVIARAYIYRLNGLGRRHVNLQQAGALVVIHALDLKVVEQPRLAI